MSIKETLIACQISPAEAVETIKAEFPGFDKPMLSKVFNPDKYGVVLHPRAYKTLHSKFPMLATEAQKRPKSKRKSTHRLTRYVKCRLTDEDFEALQRKLNASGGTAQSWLTNTIREYTSKGVSEDV